MKTTDREFVVDRLRGYALLGIILVNAPFLLTSINGFTNASAPTLGDRIAWFSVAAFFQAKSYVIFSFLFGYSLAIFLRGVERRGQPATRLYLRRLGGLFLFGAAHAILLFSGDILVLYALAGLVMIPLRKRSDRTILLVAAGLFVLQVVILGLIAVGTSAIEADATTRAIDEAFAHGSFLEATLTRLVVWPFALGFVTLLQGFLVASLFCVGLVCGRHRLLEDPSRNRRAWKRVCAIGFAVGLPIQLHRYAIGPAESILRAITYRRRPKLPRLVPPPVETETA